MVTGVVRAFISDIIHSRIVSIALERATGSRSQDADPQYGPP